MNNVMYGIKGGKGPTSKLPEGHDCQLLKGQHVEGGGHGSLAAALVAVVEALERLVGSKFHHHIDAKVSKVILQ